eukprot:scaffold10655_cov51-Cyclotella_meneghiniana.AAC.6
MQNISACNYCANGVCKRPMKLQRSEVLDHEVAVAKTVAPDFGMGSDPQYEEYCLLMLMENEINPTFQLGGFKDIAEAFLEWGRGKRRSFSVISRLVGITFNVSII